MTDTPAKGTVLNGHHAEIHRYTYTPEDLVIQSSPWEKFSRSKVKFNKFDEELCRRWDEAMEAGMFRYKLDSLQTKILPGPLRFVAQLNVKRAQERRAPQNIIGMNHPFDPKKFNFTKIKPGEVVFELCPQRDSSPQENGTMDTHDRTTSDETPASKRVKKSAHMVIINVSPLEYGNILMVPSLQDCLPQVLTEEALLLAMEMTLLSKHQGFRMGFNSLCAYSSVNHLHFHGYYLEHELGTESCVTVPFHSDIHVLNDDYPALGFAFQLKGKDVTGLARQVYQVADYLQRHEIAHNVFMTRGTQFGEDANSPNRTLRVYLWPRQPVTGAKNDFVFNPALCELAGHLPIKVEDGYRTVTEELAVNTLRTQSLQREEFDALKTELAAMLG
ncbi:PREDICTED: GDP-D-glucose phosphorylase 1-like isoform X1 [Branchiostoma belcheri]|uniref:GDP-D-glucose phosphorylase 1 n=1 Tax=Branchiostoma belcheri TaxID=7741 RepID=A0A6P4Z397_BRABE|nr:PREDICTED: GDP-D-glucose phosphorylase 1-like isoform X1 [Branchiostoma belcheri]